MTSGLFNCYESAADVRSTKDTWLSRQKLNFNLYHRFSRGVVAVRTISSLWSDIVASQVVWARFKLYCRCSNDIVAFQIISSLLKNDIVAFQKTFSLFTLYRCFHAFKNCVVAFQVFQIISSLFNWYWHVFKLSRRFSRYIIAFQNISSQFNLCRRLSNYTIAFWFVSSLSRYSTYAVAIQVI